MYAFLSIIFPTVTNFAYVNDNYGKNIAKWFIELNIALCILYMMTFPFQICCNKKIKSIIRYFSIFVIFTIFVNNISYLSYINRNKSNLIEEINIFNYKNNLNLYEISYKKDLIELIENVEEIKHDMKNEKTLIKELKKTEEKYTNEKPIKSDENQKNIKSNKINESN
jgi:hypothetical protein